MLTKTEIEQLISERNSSLNIVKPTITPKSSAMRNRFNHIYMNDIKQDYVICIKCKDLLVYKSSSGTNSLSKHIRTCENVKTIASNAQTSIKQFYASSKTEPVISTRVKQEIMVACAEFAALDYRPFRTIQSIGFKNSVQKFFNAG